MRSLDAAWQAHLAPRQPDALTVVSLFAGCGGSSLGYSMAGYRELLAVEWDDNAVATFRLNFPEVPVYHGDIAALSVADVLAQTGLAPGTLDVLDGSPPCQGFSTAGKRQLDDPRNGLFREYVRLLEGLQPKAFVLENVSGMVKGKMRLVFVEALQALKAAGYRVSARVLNAMYFGVPQSRARLIVIGVRADLAVAPSHPTVQASPITVRQAITDLVITDRANLEKRVHPGQRAIVARAQAGEQLSKYHPKGYWFNYFRVHRDRPSQALPKSCHDKVYHYIETRVLAPTELRALASFPLAFQFAGGYEDLWHRIGNSVPPLFMRAIAQHVRQTLLSEAVRQAMAGASDG